MPQRLTMKISKLSSAREEWSRPRREAKPLDGPRVETVVREIIEEVKKKGNEALIAFTKKFDGIDLSRRGLVVTEADIRCAYKNVSEAQIKALTYLKDRIADIERFNLTQSSFSHQETGLTIAHTVKPIQSVGCYVPGGLAAYPSTLLMVVTPAKTAGVPRIAICSPPTCDGEIHPLILVAADICGVNEVYRVGGAQAIAALAYGTESIDPVMKIVGPGRRIVNHAKALVSKDVAIDFPAGPSELLIIADETADPRFIAVDLISQAEHAPDNLVGVITPSESCARRVINEIEKRVEEIDRREVVVQSLTEKGFVLVCEDMDDAIEFANAFAPEHLEIVTRKPADVANRIGSAGLILLGPYTPVAGSDYGFGTNHVLPTGGFSRMYSGLSALDFVKRISVVECSKKHLGDMEDVARTLALSEGLPNHFLALKERLTD